MLLYLYHLVSLQSPMVERKPKDVIENTVRDTLLVFAEENNLIDLLYNLSIPKEDCAKEEELCSAERNLNEQISRSKNEAINLKTEINALENAYLKLHKEKEVAEAGLEEIRNENIPTKEDDEVLKNRKQTIQLLKSMTGIQWDYSAPKNPIKGYTCGILKNYVHAFEIPVDENSQDKLWNEIKKAGTNFWIQRKTML